MPFYISIQLSSFGCPCGMDDDNENFLQKNFPDSEKDNIFRSTSDIKDDGSRIVG